jgi:hypothetical protein
MKYAYDYQNMHTRGWVRGDFADYDLITSTLEEATTSLEAVAKSWPTGTTLRLVEIDADGKETFPAVAAKGSRGPLPKDKKDR